MGERLISEAEEAAWDTHEYQKPTTETFREGWDLIWGKKRVRPAPAVVGGDPASHRVDRPDDHSDRGSGDDVTQTEKGTT